MAIIKKAARVIGRTLEFRNVEETDAAFIISLRGNKTKGEHLNSGSLRIHDQKKWISEYQKKIDQAYFIIESQGQKIGTVRLYDASEKSFCWGSWVLAQNAPFASSIESVLMVYDYAINVLGFSKSHFDVRKKNAKVCSFHESFGAVRKNEDDINVYYDIEKEKIISSFKRFNRFLPNPVVVR
jgi:hypothetical protein